MLDNFCRSTNQLLSTLSHIEYQHLAPYLQEVTLKSGEILYEPNELINIVYFPEQTIISLILVMSDNSMTEIASVGREGMIGLPVLLDDRVSTSRAIVKISGRAIALAADIFRQKFYQSRELQQLLWLYTQIRLNYLAQIASCQSHHAIEQRLARWLLLICDSRKQDIVPLTQKFIAQILGVRRASITEAAIYLQKSGAIAYRRGEITILNRPQLESIACECYGAIKKQFSRLSMSEEE
jgi:CRP-like cAMP-binding protein